MATLLQEPEKSVGKVDIAVNEADSEKCDPGTSEHIRWETGFWKRFPWVGFGAIFMMLVCIAMDGVILGTSRGKYREEWPAHKDWHFISNKWKAKAQIQPSVLLAIVNTVSNVCLGIAIANGVAVAWWRRAMKGSTIANLHKSWGFASSVLQLLTAGKMFNKIALAALMAKLALVDNVLLQQATSASPGWYLQKNMTVKLPVAKSLPADYTGTVISHNSTDTVVSSSNSWSLDIYQWLNSTIIQTDMYFERSTNETDNYGNPIDLWNYDTGCIGICRPKFQGFGFDWQCGETDVSPTYDVTPATAYQNTLGQNSSANASSASAGTLAQNPLLSVIAQFIPKGARMDSGKWINGDRYIYNTSLGAQTLDVGSIAMQFKWASLNSTGEGSGSCKGATYHRFCTLRPATINYTLEITNVSTDAKGLSAGGKENGITMIQSLTANYSSPEWVNQQFNEPVNHQFDGYDVVGPAYTPYEDKYDSNLRQIAAWLQDNFAAYVEMNYVNTTAFKGYVPNADAAQSRGEDISPLFGNYWLQFDAGDICEFDVDDPSYYIGSGLNMLMMRSSMRAATQYLWNEAEQWGTVNQAMVQTYRQGQWIRSVYYKADWRFGAVAMALIFLCALCVLPSYYGFWQLGRKVTLGPIEVAGAFQAPVMDHPTVAGNGEVDQFVKEIGERQVRYGQVGGQQRLGVAPPSEVVRPGS